MPLKSPFYDNFITVSLSFNEIAQGAMKSSLCSDEIFGGYPWFYRPEMLYRDFFPWIHEPMERAGVFRRSIAKPEEGYNFLSNEYRKIIADCPVLPGDSDAMRQSRIATCLSVGYFMTSLLERKDRMSMYHGLEVRVPFCDHRIAQYMYAVPWEFKDLRGREKGLLREAVKDLLPAEVLWRKKSPYPKTHHPQYAALVRSRLEALLKRPDAALFYLVSRRALCELLESSDSCPWYGQLMTGPQTMAYFLQLQFWLEHYQIDVL